MIFIFWLAPTSHRLAWHLLYPVGVHYSRPAPLFEITRATSRLRAKFASLMHILHVAEDRHSAELAAEVFNDLMNFT